MQPFMELSANYIKRIEINGLWDRFNIVWDLRPDVNILSGINGVGKTTILNRSVGYLEQLSGEVKSDEKNGVRVFFDNPEATYIPYDVIRSYDRPLIMGDFTARMADKNVKSELDWQLYLLQRRYLDYQVNIGNKMIDLLSSNNEEERGKAATLSVAKRRFQDMVDELFSYTRKKIDRKRNDIAFYQDGELLFPYKLSSGEKQMLVILLTVLVQDNAHCVLFMDEPEASLHIEWQQRLIAMIRELNPNVQIILTTHSPAVIMGFVSGIQLSANNMLKVGDWIAMPKYGADGTVIEVTLNTVKVRNWDNTITTIPPYLLVSDSFQNWRGMQESGGRRVKRSINIDMNSVRFCTPEMLAKYKKIQLLTDYVEQTEKVVKEYNKEHHIDNSILVNGGDKMTEINQYFTVEYNIIPGCLGLFH
jgi:ABC-type cobalamin/Fe3+-siderophores transport system ATPase subunit